jgi:hypothetical protein
MSRRWWLIGLLIALGITLLSPLASSSPDGLERVAEEKGFLGLARGAPYGVFADYLFPGVGNEALATILAGLVGTAVTFGVVMALVYLLLWWQRSLRGRGRGW